MNEKSWSMKYVKVLKRCPLLCSTNEKQEQTICPSLQKVYCPFSVRHCCLHRLILHHFWAISDLVRLNGKKSIHYSGSKLASPDSLLSVRSWVLQPVARMLRPSKSPPKVKFVLVRRLSQITQTHSVSPMQWWSSKISSWFCKLAISKRGAGGMGSGSESGLRSVGGVNGITVSNNFATGGSPGPKTIKTKRNIGNFVCTCCIRNSN